MNAETTAALLQQAEALTRKFVEKVETGRARSRETYAECRAFIDAVNDARATPTTDEQTVKALMCGEDICTEWGFHCETGFCDRAQAMIDALTTPAPTPTTPEDTLPAYLRPCLTCGHMLCSCPVTPEEDTP